MNEASLKAAARCGKHILILGASGSGKTTLAEKLGERMIKDGKAVSVFRVHQERGYPNPKMALVAKIQDAIGNNSDCLIVDDMDRECCDEVMTIARLRRLQVIATLQVGMSPFRSIQEKVKSRKMPDGILDNFHVVVDVSNGEIKAA